MKENETLPTWMTLTPVGYATALLLRELKNMREYLDKRFEELNKKLDEQNRTEL